MKNTKKIKRANKTIVRLSSLLLILVIFLSWALIPSFAEGKPFSSYYSIITKYFPSMTKYLKAFAATRTEIKNGTQEKTELIVEQKSEQKTEDNNSTVSGEKGADALLQYESEVLRLVNEIRVSYGLKALKNDMRLVKLARLKSKDMHDLHYFAHESPTYNRAFDMMKNAGISYRNAGENIAMGYKTPEDVVEAWMNSPGHRANILSEKYTSIGIGYEADGHYCTQMFIG